MSTGPIDFESRRQQIKLSYTKSIRESEARAAARREAAAEKERQKLEAEAKAKAEAEARARARAEAQAKALRAAAEKAEAAEAEAARLAEEEAEAEAQAARLVEEEAETRAETARAAKQQAAAIAAAAVAQRERMERERLDIAEATQQAEKGVDGSSPPAGDATTEPPALVIRTDFAVSQPFDRCSASASSGILSPALGIPGSFPGMGSPEFRDEVPPSAISDTTEFDAEAQTEPPRPQSPLSPTMGQRTLYPDQEEMSLSISEYKSPFDTTSPSNDGVSVKIALDASSPQKQAEPTPTLSEFSVGNGIPGSFKDEDYTPQPLAQSTYETKVTILGRDSGFPPMSSEGDAASTKARPKDHVRIKSTVSAHQASDRDVSTASDKSTDCDAGTERLEDFYPGPKVSETAARLRDSGTPKSPHGHSRTWSMEEPIAAPRSSVDTRRTLETRPSLNVPRNSSINRISQNSAWTDYSIESSGDYPPFPPNLSSRDSACQETASISEAGSRPQSIAYDRDSRACTSSRGTSPHESYRSPSFNDQPQLPELDTGGGFVVDYAPRKTSDEASLPVPLLPDHSPPPPPEMSAFPDLGSAPPSEYFNDTRPNSYAQGMQDDNSFCTTSRPQSENFDQPISTPRSMDQGSFETTDARLRMDSQTTLADSLDQTDIAAGMAPKEKKRLFTRLETIKELVDTEAFFIRDMNIVEEIYKGTAEACPRLDDTTIKLIFRNTDQIIAFHSAFLAELKEGVASVYVPKSHRIPKESQLSDGASTVSTPASGHLSDARDRETSLGPIFVRNIDKMKTAHETFLKNSDQAAKRLIQIQEDPTVKVWLNECNEVARDLTKAWNLDSLLIKPMQRITKYPNLLIQLLHETPPDHPDRAGLESAKASLEEAIEEINKTKKNFELVGQIVGRKRKESDVRAGFAKAFGKRVDKLQSANNRPLEDPEYLKIHEKFGDDYLRLQVVLRDVEFYTRQTTTYVHEFLQYLSSMELVMRLQPSPHPEIESKWVRFNVSMRDIEKVALEQHLSHVRKQVIEPFEMVIKAYGNPSLAMKKRSKRRLDYDRALQLKKAGKKIDKQLAECVEQYEALNEALKKELPKLSALTEKVGNICLGNFVNIQTHWYSIWKEKVKFVLDDQSTPELADIVATFHRDFKFQEEQMSTISIANPIAKGRPSQSGSSEGPVPKLRTRPSELSTGSSRGRGLSINSDVAPSLPTPDFARRHSGQLTMSPTQATAQSPHQFYYKDYYAGINGGHARGGSGSPSMAESSLQARPLAPTSNARPGTGQSYESTAAPRQSMDSGTPARRSSNSNYGPPALQNNPTPDSQSQRYSGLFHSALPLPDGPERAIRPSRASSRASSRERAPINGYNVLWLAASLFEFNIETTKHEAGYPYLTYQAGEIFDVIAEKGELWLAKNQDDPNNMVGWLWSKHFAKLADD